MSKKAPPFQPQFLAKAGTGHHSDKAENCQRNGYPALEGRTETEKRKCDNNNTVGEEIRIHFIQQSGCFVQTEIICE